MTHLGHVLAQGRHFFGLVIKIDIERRNDLEIRAITRSFSLVVFHLIGKLLFNFVVNNVFLTVFSNPFFDFLPLVRLFKFVGIFDFNCHYFLMVEAKEGATLFKSLNIIFGSIIFGMISWNKAVNFKPNTSSFKIDICRFKIVALAVAWVSSDAEIENRLEHVFRMLTVDCRISSGIASDVSKVFEWNLGQIGEIDGRGVELLVFNPLLVFRSRFD